MIKHLDIKIFGEVQGVSFRYYAREKARELVLNGFVCNEPNGTVCIEAEGEENNLHQFLKWCHAGPETARVEKVEFMFDSDIKKFNDFSVL